MGPGSRITRHLQILGRVQGVGFRFYMERKAHELNVTGWVRNRRDGSVEAVVQGSQQSVDTIVAWARNGPASAVVSEVRIAEGDGDYVAFVALPTA